MKNKLVSTSLVNAILATIYVTLISYLMQNGEKLFGKMDNLIGPISFLLLFVLSAAIMVVLVFGKPVMMYLDNNASTLLPREYSLEHTRDKSGQVSTRRKEAVFLLLYTIGWIFLFTLIALLVQIIKLDS